MGYIKNLTDISKDDIREVGGKGASLGEMCQAGIPVPSGFVITTQTYKEFSNQELPVDVKEEIFKAFDQLGAELVAVRSSAVAEDSSNSSWAGQLESYLNTSRDDLIDRIRDCWNSIKKENALAYAAQNSISEEELVVAVVVQKMVSADCAGVMFTVNPITNDASELMLEACFGLGEMLVQGMVTPDNYLINKETGEIKERSLNSQETMLTHDGENKEVPIPDDKKGTQILSEDQIQGLLDLALAIEKHYGKPQDIEWVIENGEISIVQSRPITTI